MNLVTAIYQQWDQHAIEGQYYLTDQNDTIQHASVPNEDQRRQNVFICPNKGCNRSFSWKNNLTWHLRNSCGVSPRFKCPYCDYKCKVKGDVRKHIFRIHKGNDVYVVDLFENT